MSDSPFEVATTSSTSISINRRNHVPLPLPFPVPLGIQPILSIPSISPLGSLIHRRSVHAEPFLLSETTASFFSQKCGDWMRRGQGVKVRAFTFSLRILSHTKTSMTSMTSTNFVAATVEVKTSIHRAQRVHLGD
jgi:hypothetical protein